MNEFTRRAFLQRTGLAAIGAAGLVLRADAAPTPTSHDAEEAEKILIEMGPPSKTTVAMRGSQANRFARARPVL